MGQREQNLFALERMECSCNETPIRHPKCSKEWPNQARSSVSRHCDVAKQKEDAGAQDVAVDLPVDGIIAMLAKKSAIFSSGLQRLIHCSL